MRQRVLALLLKIAFTFTVVRSGSADDAGNTIVLTHPGLGEVLWIDTQYRVEWKGMEVDHFPVSIKLFAKDGQVTIIASNVAIHNGAYEWNISSTIQPQDGYCMYLKNERTGQIVNDMKPFQISASEGVRRATRFNATSSAAANPSLSGFATIASNSQPSSSTPMPTTQIPSSQNDVITNSKSSTRSAIITSLWSSSYESLLYSSVSISLPSPVSTSRIQSTVPERAPAPNIQYIVAMVLGSIACIAIGLNVGWLVIRQRRRKRERKDQVKDDTAAQTESNRRRRSKPGNRAEVASYSKRQTGIPELEADLAPAVAAVKPGLCYELEALEKPLELRASVATWLSRRTGGRQWSRSSRGPPHTSSMNS
ncbi:hypothetical protein PG996_014170 [Apiospora saccharicola]|uniref:Yeast cell wall synthesis Kre9/Knh1-like N-terminal domain-containing protein n=1 Tax=Apiospora saccharicola TaxID=335842 RepID=A0ABR1THJ9_9PEZI